MFEAEREHTGDVTVPATPGYVLSEKFYAALGSIAWRGYLIETAGAGEF